jgi:hypothetical protein
MSDDMDRIMRQPPTVNTAGSGRLRNPAPQHADTRMVQIVEHDDGSASGWCMRCPKNSTDKRYQGNPQHRSRYAASRLSELMVWWDAHVHTEIHRYYLRPDYREHVPSDEERLLASIFGQKPREGREKVPFEFQGRMGRA